MSLSRLFVRPKTRAIRRPLVEPLEGRQLLTTIVSPDLGHVGLPTAGAVSSFPDRHPTVTVTGRVGDHAGTNSMFQGNHPGISIAEVPIKP